MRSLRGDGVMVVVFVIIKVVVVIILILVVDTASIIVTTPSFVHWHVEFVNTCSCIK